MTRAIIVIFFCAYFLSEAQALELHGESPAVANLYKPISLKCPKGIEENYLEVVRKNREGYLVKVRASFEGNTIIFLTIHVAPPGEIQFRETRRGVPKLDAIDENDLILLEASKPLQKLKDLICDNPDPSVRSRFGLILDANRKSFEK